MPRRIGGIVGLSVESNLFRIMGIGLGPPHHLPGRTLKRRFDRNPAERSVSRVSKYGRME